MKHILKIKKEMDSFETLREKVILSSREILRFSKKAIFSIHRDESKKAKKLIDSAEKDIKKINKMIEKTPRLHTVGAFSSACQEFAEAKTFYSYVCTGKIPAIGFIGYEDYLMGLCDLTGELGRRAVMHSKDEKEVTGIYKTVNDIFGSFLDFDLRNGELRKKADAIKWNLKKIEDVVYERRNN